MPTAPPKGCLKCGSPVFGGPQYCTGCRPNEDKSWANHTDHKERVKNEPWSLWYRRAHWTHPVKGLRAVVLGKPENVICRNCKRVPSTVADHIVPHKGDWKLFTRLENLQGLCAPCHDEKTRRERGTNKR
jgi:5-methylcytosine-specific restriction protein A